jgi:hypothetical protein
MLTVYPKYISLKYWAATVISDYDNESLPILGIFLRAGVPSPASIVRGRNQDNFKDWQQWARIVYNIMNSESINTDPLLDVENLVNQ